MLNRVLGQFHAYAELCTGDQKATTITGKQPALLLFQKEGPNLWGTEVTTDPTSSGSQASIFTASRGHLYPLQHFP